MRISILGDEMVDFVVAFVPDLALAAMIAWFFWKFGYNRGFGDGKRVRTTEIGRWMAERQHPDFIEERCDYDA